MYSYIGTYLTYPHHDQKEWIVHIKAKRLPYDGFANDHDSIQLPFFHEPHYDCFPHPSDNDCSDTEANGENACIDPEQPPVQIHIYGTPHLDNCLAGNGILNEYFHIFDNEIDLWSPFSRQEEYQLAHRCVKHQLSSATINELFRNPKVATVSNLTSSHTWFIRLNEMSYVMRIDFGNQAKYVAIDRPIQTTFATMITHVSFTAILFYTLSSSCNSLHSANICCMLQQRN